MKTSYTCLHTMLANANYRHDAYWDLGLYDVAIRYTKIGQRILKAITDPKNGVIGNYLKNEKL